VTDFIRAFEASIICSFF